MWDLQSAAKRRSALVRQLFLRHKPDLVLVLSTPLLVSLAKTKISTPIRIPCQLSIRRNPLLDNFVKLRAQHVHLMLVGSGEQRPFCAMTSIRRLQVRVCPNSAREREMVSNQLFAKMPVIWEYGYR